MADTLETTTLEEAQEAGFLGSLNDPTPNENYTVQGVGKGLPTPETDTAAREAAAARRAELVDRFSTSPEEAPAPKKSSSSSS